MKELLKSIAAKLSGLKDLALSKLNRKQEECAQDDSCCCCSTEDFEVKIPISKPKKKRKNVRNKRLRY